MRIRLAVIIPAILTAAVAGSVTAGSAASLAVAQAHSAHVVAAAPNTFFHG